MAQLVEKPPALADELATWLSPELVNRLAGAMVKGEAQPVRKLGDLVNFVNRYGHRWWVHVPRLGAKRAERLVQWLAPLADQLLSPVMVSARVPNNRKVAANVALLEQQPNRDRAGRRSCVGASPLKLDGNEEGSPREQVCMDADHFDAAARLVELLTSMGPWVSDACSSVSCRESVAEIRGIGEGVAFVAGRAAMQRLAKQVYAAGGSGYDLDRLWDGIGACRRDIHDKEQR